MKSVVLEVKRGVVDKLWVVRSFLFPERCHRCGEEGSWLCVSCSSKLPLAKPVCLYCMKPSAFGVTHARCNHTYGVNRLLTLFEYKNAARLLIHDFKFRHHRNVGKHLLEKLDLKELSSIEVIVALPSPTTRLRKRLYNPSTVLATDFSQKLGVPVVSALWRTECTTQRGLTRLERFANVKGTFMLDEKQAVAIRGKRLLLIDDVVTTGASVRAAARELWKGKPSDVWVFALALD